MAAFGNSPNPWESSYDTCSQGLCSMYCPQWCYLVFPPPPPISDDSDSDAGDFSPVIIAVIGILAAAFVLLSYYTLLSKYCRRSDGAVTENDPPRNDNNSSHVSKTTVYKFKKSQAAGGDCAVCLSEFDDGEVLRLLPGCGHAFHAACIDAWLDSHATCPLCRSSINDNPSVSKQVVQSSEPVVVVIVVTEEEGETDGGDREEGAFEPKSPVHRSASSVGFRSARLLVADILRQDEEGEDDRNHSVLQIGSSSNHDHYERDSDRDRDDEETALQVGPLV